MDEALAVWETKYKVAAGLLGSEFGMRMAELDEPHAVFRECDTLNAWCATRRLRTGWVGVTKRNMLLLATSARCPHDTVRRFEGAEKDGMSIPLPAFWEAVERELERRAGRCVQHEDCLTHPALGVSCLTGDASRWPSAPDADFAMWAVPKPPFHPRRKRS